eukprot:SAG11_NODE_692_length_7698_cov_4.143308_10_plen_929_part_00
MHADDAAHQAALAATKAVAAAAAAEVNAATAALEVRRLQDAAVEAAAVAARDAEEAAAAATKLQALQRGKLARRANRASPHHLDQHEPAGEALLEADAASSEGEVQPRSGQEPSAAAAAAKATKLQVQVQTNAAEKIQAVHRGNAARAVAAGERKRAAEAVADAAAEERARENAIAAATALAAELAAKAVAAEAKRLAAEAAAEAAKRLEAEQMAAAEAAATAARDAEEAARAATKLQALQRGRCARRDVAAEKVAAAEAEAEAAAAVVAEAAHVRAEEDLAVAAAVAVAGAEPRPRALPPPPLPGGYSPRPDVVNELLRVVTNGGGGALVVRGQGGLGKTTCVAALLHEHGEELQAYFPDGIYWLTLGEQVASIAALQTAVLRCLEDTDSASVAAHEQGPQPQAPAGAVVAVADEREGAMRIARRLEGKKLLLVLDDVWHEADARLFCSLPQCAIGGSLVLLTSRKEGLLGAPTPGADAADAPAKAREHVLSGFTDSDGAAILHTAMAAAKTGAKKGARWVDQSGWGELKMETAEALLEACERLPLAVSIIAGAIADLAPRLEGWGEVLSRLQGESKDLGSEAASAVGRAMSLSLESLGYNLVYVADRMIYLELGFFPEDIWVPEQVILRYFDGRAGVGLALRRLAERRLLQLDEGVRPGSAAVRLHDLCREHVRTLSSGREKSQHAQLLDAYAAIAKAATGQAEPVCWWKCLGSAEAVDAEYICNWLCYHLCEAQQQAGREESARLMAEFDWLDLKLRATRGEVAGLLHDFRRYVAPINGALGTVLTHYVTCYCAHLIFIHGLAFAMTYRRAESVGHAFQMCSHIVSDEPNQLAFQLRGRLDPELPVSLQWASSVATIGALQIYLSWLPSCSAPPPPRALFSRAQCLPCKATRRYRFSRTQGCCAPLRARSAQRWLLTPIGCAASA